MKVRILLPTLLIFIYSNVQSQSSLLWSTYFGGSATERNENITSDSEGNVYLTGITYSQGGLAFNGFQMNYGGGLGDAYLAKIDSNGNLVWATYYGGSGTDTGTDIAVDNDGNVYLAGTTDSPDNIAFNGHLDSLQSLPMNGVMDAFLIKFNAAGNRIWGTYYGGTGYERYTRVKIDGGQHVVIGGITLSYSGIDFNGYNWGTLGNNEAFYAKFDSSGQLVRASYFGTGDTEGPWGGLAVDPSGNIIVATSSTSQVGLGVNGHQNFSHGGFDGAVASFAPDGTLNWSTYFGGETHDKVSGVDTDGQGNVYLFGVTSSQTGIAYQAYQPTLAFGPDYFIAKFNPAGVLQWATYYGGDGAEYEQARIKCFEDGRAVIAGRTTSQGVLVLNGFQDSLIGPSGGIYATFTAAGQLHCATYFNSQPTSPGAVGISNPNTLYIGGYTNDTAGIATGGFQLTNAGHDDAWVARVQTCTTPAAILPPFSSRLSVWPNPVNDYLFIQLPADDPFAIVHIISAEGKRIFSSACVTGGIPVSHLAEGLYLVNMVSNAGTYSQKFIIRR